MHAPRPRMLLGLTRWSGRNSAKLRVIGAMAAGAGPFARHAQVVRCEQRVSRAKGSAGGAFCRFDHVSSSVGSSQLRSKRAGRVVTPATRAVSTRTSRRERQAVTENTDTSTSAASPSERSSSDQPDFVVENLANDALGHRHALCQKWVVFSDLHVNRKSCAVAMEVLRKVHATALAEDAGIIFLGDFWHARGALPVEPLVDALTEIGTWSVPTVMIPGNHDQVTVGGELHALTPLEKCNPTNVKVFTKPTLWRNALWLPYRRDQRVLKEAVAEAVGFTTRDGDANGNVANETSSETEKNKKRDGPYSTHLSAVMCHADVVGASMNESFQARDGISPDLFNICSSVDGSADVRDVTTGADVAAGLRTANKTANTKTNKTTIPTYTGHYHKPHTVPGTRITYVGSPYQVSRAERGQQKALLVLDATLGWAGASLESLKSINENETQFGDPAVTDGEIKKSLIPLDIGPRHFSVTGELGVLPQDARAGDCVRWTLPLSSAIGLGGSVVKKTKKDDENAESPACAAIADAMKQGIEVEITYEQVARPARIPLAEELGPNGLYDAYCVAADLPREVAEFGKEILRDVAAGIAKRADADGTSVASLQMQNADGTQKHVSLHRVTVQGFGAFSNKTCYPLRNRGVCAVVGDNRNDRCSDSNGAGKTTLVMAPMWALTGKTDSRIDQGSQKSLTKTDVVSDGSAKAVVTVGGTVNGKAFEVTRIVSRTKVVSLTYQLDGFDKTLADSRLTQAAINLDLGASIIGRVAFHGQHTVGSLLDANDGALKSALGELVEAETWSLAKARISQSPRSASILVLRMDYYDQKGAFPRTITLTVHSYQSLIHMV